MISRVKDISDFKETDNKAIKHPGVYDISNEEYHASNGISRSGLMSFNRTPFHYYSEYLDPNRLTREKSSDAAIMGNAFHTMILEPHEFDNRFAIKLDLLKLPKTPLLREVGREEYDKAKLNHELFKNKQDEMVNQFLISSEGKNVLTQEDLNKLNKMKSNVSNHPKASSLIQGAKYEKSLYWTDPHTGLLCKCRPDIWQDCFIGDIKTAANAGYREFQRAFYSYGYHIQCAMIHEAFKNLFNILITDFVFIVVENSAPHAVAIYPLDKLSLQQSVEIFKNKLLEMKECFDKNVWPSYKTQIITLPNYAIGDF